MLNLGINKEYISNGGDSNNKKAPRSNQARVNGKDVVLGLTPDNLTSVGGSALDVAADQGHQWNYSNAQALAGILTNPNIDNNYNNTQKTFGGKTDNAAGANQQDMALKDFLQVYSVTLDDNQAGNGIGWDDIEIANTKDPAKIKEALFGTGQQDTGMIDSKNIQLGGTAAALGSMMTKESLAKFMGCSEATASQWINPLQDAMTEFEINTPQRIAAFMAQVKQESGGLTKLVENLRYQVSPAARTFGVFGGSKNAVRDFYENVLGLKPVDATKEKYSGWTDALNVKMAEKVYGYTTAKGHDELGNTKAGDGGLYLGYGLKQLTGYSNVKAFADYVDGHSISGQATGQQILADPKGTIGTNLALAARSAAWFWSVNYAKYKTSTWHTDGKLNDKASKIAWNDTAVPDTQEAEFDKITKGVNRGADSTIEPAAMNLNQAAYLTGSCWK